MAGLPTNHTFLQQLAAHPAFAAAELDTGFIPRHLNDLLGGQHLSIHDVALAALAHHMMEVKEVG